MEERKKKQVLSRQKKGKSKRMPIKKISEILEKGNSCEKYCHYCRGYFFDDD